MPLHSAGHEDFQHMAVVLLQPSHAPGRAACRSGRTISRYSSRTPRPERRPPSRRAPAAYSCETCGSPAETRAGRPNPAVRRRRREIPGPTGERREALRHRPPCPLRSAGSIPPARENRGRRPSPRPKDRLSWRGRRNCPPARGRLPGPSRSPRYRPWEFSPCDFPEKRHRTTLSRHYRIGGPLHHSLTVGSQHNHRIVHRRAARPEFAVPWIVYE